LNCKWQNDGQRAYCTVNKSYDYQAQQEANKVCTQYNNERKACLSRDICKWNPERGIFYGLGGGRSVPFSLWAIWIFDNIIFILLILAVIGYGTRHGSSKIVNLGIAFFALDIITRYLGFVFDFWGYRSLSVLFITGGIILIFGGWLIERWREKLVKRAREAPKSQEVRSM
jgi:hypothetical protein